MLTEDDRARMDEHDRDPDHLDHAATAALTATEMPGRFAVLEEPSWLDDEELEEMQAPRDSAFRGIWIGVAAAALTFVLVFAIPHWLGWYDVGPTTPRAKRELTPDSVISTVTAKPSTATGEAAAGPTVASAPAAATPPAAVTPPPAAAEPKAPALPHESKPAPRETKAPVATVASHEAKPAPAARESKPASAAAVARRRTFAVQIAAFKN